MHLSETEIFGEFKRVLAENYFRTTNEPNEKKCGKFHSKKGGIFCLSQWFILTLFTCSRVTAIINGQNENKQSNLKSNEME